MSELKGMLAANQQFQQGFRDGDKPTPPARKVAIVTCMDARIHPEKALGLEIGDAHMIRNAGGRASDDVTITSMRRIRSTMRPMPMRPSPRLK